VQGTRIYVIAFLPISLETTRTIAGTAIQPAPHWCGQIRADSIFIAHRSLARVNAFTEITTATFISKAFHTHTLSA
jgi:hypothetical protein